MPTVITSAPTTYMHVLPLLADAAASGRWRQHVLGIHLEGWAGGGGDRARRADAGRRSPFISDVPGAVGCHNPEFVSPGTVRRRRRAGRRRCGPHRRGTLQAKAMKGLLKLGKGQVKLVTVAADAEGAADVCREAVGRGVRVSLGHQLASSQQLAQLADAGATGLTHLGNGMPNMCAHCTPACPAGCRRQPARPGCTGTTTF